MKADIIKLIIVADAYADPRDQIQITIFMYMNSVARGNNCSIDFIVLDLINYKDN